MVPCDGFVRDDCAGRLRRNARNLRAGFGNQVPANDDFVATGTEFDGNDGAFSGVR